MAFSFEFFSGESQFLFSFWKIIWSICGQALIKKNWHTKYFFYAYCMYMLRVGKNIHDFDIKKKFSEKKKIKHMKNLQQPDTINIYDRPTDRWIETFYKCRIMDIRHLSLAMKCLFSHQLFLLCVVAYSICWSSFGYIYAEILLPLILWQENYKTRE